MCAAKENDPSLCLLYVFLNGKYIEGTQQARRVHMQTMHLVVDTRWNLLGEILIYSNQDATDASLLP